MSRHTWKVSDLLLLVLSTAMAFGAFRSFWNPPPHPNSALYLTTYLLLLALASLGAFLGRPALRRACQGYAAFGWLNLVCVIKGGFGIVTIYDGQAVADGSRMGMIFGAIGALVAAWLLEPPRAAGPTVKDTPPSDLA